MADQKKHEAFVNLCRAAREFRDTVGPEHYRMQIKTILAPFNRVGRSIGLSHVRGKDVVAATAALRKKTDDFIKAGQHIDNLVERVAVESWCKKNGYALVKVEDWRKCSELQLSNLLDEMFASSLDKPKSLG